MKTEASFWYPYAKLPDVLLARAVIDHNAGTACAYESVDHLETPYPYYFINASRALRMELQKERAKNPDAKVRYKMNTPEVSVKSRRTLLKVKVKPIFPGSRSGTEEGG